MTFTTSVVICAYTEQRWTQLLAAVASVRAQHVPVDEIVVVIDHHDVLLQRLRRAEPQLTVVANAGPRGLSGARNTGIAHSAGEIVLFLDDDAAAVPDWTRELLRGYRDPDVLGVGGAARPGWESAPPVWWPAEFGWVVGCSFRGQPETTAHVRNLMGCNMSIRRDVLAAVGGFDSGLGRTADRPLGGEETELCIQAAELFPGGHFLYEPRAVVDHVVPAARASWTYFRDRCRAEGISKAWVADRVGRDQALASERSYVTRVLPSGVVRHLTAAARGDRGGVGRAGAVVAGLAYTTSAYLRTRYGRSTDVEPGSTGSDPMLPLVVDLSEPPVRIDARTEAGSSYQSAVCLVTDGGDPVGKVRIDLDGEQLTPERVVTRIRRELEHAPGGAPPVGSASAADSASATDSRSRLSEVTVVIATRDRPALLQECLDSIFAGTRTPSQVVVVDNAPSNDQTARAVARRAATEPRLVYVCEPRPGLARAHNAALPYVTSPLVAFTDDDVVVDRRWLERMTGAFGDDPQIVCVTGLIAPRELETLPQQWIEGNTTYDKGLRRRTFDTGSHRPGDPLFPYTSGVFGSGANMGFRTAYLQQQGGFDDALGTGTFAMGGDDLAAFYDVVAGGYRLVYEPAAIVLHRHHRQYAGLRRQTYGYGAGLGAHLMRCFLHDPQMALVLLRHVATAGRRATEIVAPPAVSGLPPYPADLSRTQLRGLVSGPWRYLVSRHRTRPERAA